MPTILSSSNGAVSTTTTEPIRLNTIEEALADLADGKVIIVVDDENRENEGDFICAAEMITPEIVNFMATHGRGLICTPLEEKRADELGLDLMVSSNTALHETAFTVSIDLIGHGCTTGISAYDRSTGIRFLTNPQARPSDYARPGHIFPLRAKTGGVLRRAGHTEAAVDLARLAGLYPAGVLVEILNADGSMARLPDLVEVARRFDLKIISIDDLVAYRMRNERLVRRELETTLHTRFGAFEAVAYHDDTSGDTHLVLKKGDWLEDEPVLVRVHSSSETGDILGSVLNDYGLQINSALQKIAGEGRGVFVYLRQSDKGSMLAKLQQYKQLLEEERVEQFDLHSSVGQKDFGIGAQILRDLRITKLRLMSNAPRHKVGSIGYGLEIVEHVGLEIK